MPEEIIPEKVRDFILQHIDSITQLEALLLLRANPDERWTLGSTTKRLYTSERDVELVLSRLTTDGLLRNSEGVYRYDPSSPEMRALIEQLADIYARHLIPVTNLIHAKERRIREFADAFRFRRDR